MDIVKPPGHVPRIKFSLCHIKRLNVQSLFFKDVEDDGRCV